jgi:hypothetical protein
MGWFKQLAAQSYLQGRRAPEFAAAAQRWANAFWWPLIASAIVWWLAGWKWALLPLAVAAWWAFKSVSASLIQRHLESFEHELK